MKSLSKTELNKRISRLEKDLKEETAAGGGLTKRAIFMMATINTRRYDSCDSQHSS